MPVWYGTERDSLTADQQHPLLGFISKTTKGLLS